MQSILVTWKKGRQLKLTTHLSRNFFDFDSTIGKQKKFLTLGGTRWHLRFVQYSYVNLVAKRSNKTEMAGLEIEKSYSNIYNILGDSSIMYYMNLTQCFKATSTELNSKYSLNKSPQESMLMRYFRWFFVKHHLKRCLFCI